MLLQHRSLIAESENATGGQDIEDQIMKNGMMYIKYATLLQH